MRKQKSHFRQEETSYVYRRWLAGECCSLVGVGSIGKSNLVHHIANQETTQNYLNQAQNYRAVIIDANMLGALPAWRENHAEQFRSWAGYELLMHRLYLDFYPLDMLDSDAEMFFETYQFLQDGSNPLYLYMGIRYLELGIAFFMRRDMHILFIFDEFETLLKEMPVRFFLALRGIRDRYKSQISFLTFSRLPLVQLVSEIGLPVDEYEPFIELFSDNLYYVGPYDRVDAMDMLKNLEQRYAMTLPDAVESMLVDITGGYAGLLRTAFHALLDMKTIPNQIHELVSLLLKKDSVRQECAILWQSLSNDEKNLLKIFLEVDNSDVSTLSSDAHASIEKLIRKQIIRIDSQSKRPYLQPLIFKEYLHYTP